MAKEIEARLAKLGILLVDVFGEPGRNVRAAIGVSALPRNALVELQMTVELEA